MSSSALATRAAQFLAQPVPEELKPNYVPDSLAEIVLKQCAAGEAPDPELLELAEMASMDYEEVIAQAKSAELKGYYRESQEILREILAAHG